MRAKFGETFYELAKRDPQLIMLVADISPAGSMEKFRREFPSRFINTGVAEQIMIGMAAGMAMRGFRPFAYSIAPFSIYRPFEFVRVDLAYQNLPVTVVGVGGGLAYSTLGSTHHAMEDLAVMGAIPNMKVLVPCDPLEGAMAATWCAREAQGPTYLRLGKAGEPTYTDKAEEPFIFGKLRYLVRGGESCVLACGPTAVRLAFECKKRNSSLAIVSCHTVKPFDFAGLEELCQRHRKLIVIEEHVPQGGVSSRVKEFAWDHKKDIELTSYTLKDEFIHNFGSHEEILEKHGLTSEKITV